MRYVILLLFPIYSLAWWRSSRWSPTPKSELDINSPECSDRFISHSSAKSNVYRVGCESQEPNTEVVNNITESDCLIRCFEKASLFDSTGDLKKDLKLEIEMQLRSVTSAWDLRSKKCWCSGLTLGPSIEPQDHSNCEKIIISKLPLICLWTPQQECEEAPPDSCNWNNNCCTDSLTYSSPTRYSDDDTSKPYVAFVVAGCSFLVVIIIIIIVSCYIWTATLRTDTPPTTIRTRTTSHLPYGTSLDSEELNKIVQTMKSLKKDVPNDNQELNTEACPVCFEVDNTPIESTVSSMHMELHSELSQLLDGSKDIKMSGWAPLRCGHTLHMFCIYEWILELASRKRPLVCPICRSAISDDYVNNKTIFLKSPNHGPLRVSINPTTTVSQLQEQARSGLCLSGTIHIVSPTSETDTSLFDAVSPNITLRVGSNAPDEQMSSDSESDVTETN